MTGSYEVTFARPVRASRCSGSADRSQLRQPKRQSELWVRPSPRTYLAPDPPIHQAADAGRLIIPVRIRVPAPGARDDKE